MTKKITKIFSACAYFIAFTLLVSCSGKKNRSNSDSTAGVIENSATPTENGITTDKEKKDGLPTVIDFSATWCGPCRQIAPVFDRLESEYKEQLNFERVDIDAEPSKAEEYHVSSIPTFIFLDESGKEIGRIVGANAEELNNKLNEIIKQ